MRYIDTKLLIWLIFFASLLFLFASFADAQNVLFITIDTVQAKLIGNPKVMPYLNEIKKDSIYFENAYCASNYTPSSHASIFTSLLVSKHGLQRLEGLNPELDYLPEIFQKEGYYTYGAIAARGLWSSGFERGFDEFHDAVKDGQGDDGDFGVDSTDITKDFLGWYNKKGKTKKKLFIWLHYFDPHYPYKPNKEFNVFSKLDAQKDPINYRDFSDEMFEKAKLYYWGEVFLVDYAIGQIFLQLKEKREYRKWIIIITNDHGENIGENKPYYGHGGMSEEIIKSIVLLKFPEKRKRTDSENYFMDIDIAPTLLDYCKIKIPKSFDGKSYFSKKYKRAYAISESNDLKVNVISGDFPLTEEQIEQMKALGYL